MGVTEEGEGRPVMIKVTKLPDDVTEDFLWNYFENELRHGGGEVEFVDLSMRTRTAYITFKESRGMKFISVTHH